MVKIFHLCLFIFLGLSVGGCVSGFPPVFTYFGYVKTAADVGSYAATNKSTTDHVLSAMTKKDCNLFRFLIREEVCREYEKEEDITLAKAEYQKEDIQILDSIKDPKITITYPEFDNVFSAVTVLDRAPPAVTIDYSVIDEIPLSVIIDYSVIDEIPLSVIIDYSVLNDYRI